MRSSWLFALLFLSLADCGKKTGDESPHTAAGVGSTSPQRAKPVEPVRVEVLDESEKPPTFVVRGGQGGPEKFVFLHGMCGHGLGYAQSFQQTAAARGTLIAPQADVPCDGGPWARWSKDLEALDARITKAFVALGHSQPLTDLVVIGYSQGATRAESLARRFPERYSRLVLMGGPYVAKPAGLEQLRAAVAMAGDRDRLDLMQASARALKSAKIPSTFLLIPGAPHGSMGNDPERTMESVFAWIAENQRAR